MKKVMNKKLTKALLLTACALVLVCATVMGTVAYLTATQTVSNTFTYGNVSIVMNERKTDEYGVFDEENTLVTDQNTYKLIPGHTYKKNTTIHVGEDSENCYLFVKVTAVSDKIAYTFASTETTSWTKLEGSNDVYCYTVTGSANATVSANASIQVLESFKVDGTAEIADLEAILEDIGTGKIVTVTGYAVQAAGFTSAEDAWDATFGATTNP